MSKKQDKYEDKYAEHEDAPETTGDLPINPDPDAGKLTPLQAAELKENMRPWMERFKVAVDDVAARHQHGIAPAPALVAELRALYGEMAAADGTPPEPAPAV